MKLPLLGIIVIVCLQLGFTALNAIDRPLEALVIINAVTMGTNPVADLRDNFTVPNSLRNSSTGNTIISTSTWRRNTRVVEPAYAGGQRIANTADFNKFRRMSQYVAMQKPFESTVITYPRVVMAVSESDCSSPTNAVATSEKRSFVSRTASVLKKPYTWLRALGSKLN